MQYDNGVPAHRIQQAQWQKSSYSVGGNCVEVARVDGGRIAVRNSRHPEGPALLYTRDELAAFLSGARSGEFDHLIE
ncbi:DUF397 domain-containing protein [Streptomyces sp. NPDC007088]|uniref:DUF397 domain-containing protein n=1 Tax=Streptomyces sp. NPDC007088 TaxID=3364773 RepID=UPI00367EB1B9